MTASLSRVASRAAFWVVNAAILALAWLAFVDPVAAWFSDRTEDLVRKADLLARYERALGALAPDRPVPADVFLPGATDAVRAAALQDAVKRAAAASGVRILSVSALPQTAGRPATVGIRVDMSGPMRSLGQAVARLETGTPMLAVSRAVVRASLTREEAPGELTPLEAQLDIVGFGGR
ncbi:type II secretion system protein GspM [Alsobacter sp. R-9]